LASNISIATNEKQIFAAVLEIQDYFLEIEDNYFNYTLTQDLYKVLKTLQSEGLNFTTSNIVSYGNTVNNEITESLIESFREEPYDFGKFNTYYKRLKSDYAKNQIQNKILKEVLVEVSSNDELNENKIEELVYSITQNLELIKDQNDILISGNQALERFRSSLYKRKNGEYKYSYGDWYLDSHITTGPSPGEITTILAATGVGKSTFGINLLSKQINKRIPCIYISLEMDLISTMDRTFALRNNIPISEFYPDRNGNINDYAFKIVKEEERLLGSSKTFFFVEKENLSIADVDNLIETSRKKMGLSKKDNVIVTIDLLTMLRDFSGGDPAKYEDSMNLLSAVAKKQRVHFIAIVQANRSADSGVPQTIDGIDKLRPSLNTIKNSNAIGERSRIVLAAFRKKYYAERFFPDSDETLAMDDIYELQILKQSNGKVGDILKYNHIPGVFSLKARLTQEQIQEIHSPETNDEEDKNV
jgi:replicative DNA helicase